LYSYDWGGTRGGRGTSPSRLSQKRQTPLCAGRKKGGENLGGGAEKGKEEPPSLDHHDVHHGESDGFLLLLENGLQGTASRLWRKKKEGRVTVTEEWGFWYYFRSSGEGRFFCRVVEESCFGERSLSRGESALVGKKRLIRDGNPGIRKGGSPGGNVLMRKRTPLLGGRRQESRAFAQKGGGRDHFLEGEYDLRRSPGFLVGR